MLFFSDTKEQLVDKANELRKTITELNESLEQEHRKNQGLWSELQESKEKVSELAKEIYVLCRHNNKLQEEACEFQEYANQLEESRKNDQMELTQRIRELVAESQTDNERIGELERDIMTKNETQIRLEMELQFLKSELFQEKNHKDEIVKFLDYNKRRLEDLEKETFRLRERNCDSYRTTGCDVNYRTTGHDANYRIHGNDVSYKQTGNDVGHRRIGSDAINRSPRNDISCKPTENDVRRYATGNDIIYKAEGNDVSYKTTKSADNCKTRGDATGSDVTGSDDIQQRATQAILQSLEDSEKTIGRIRSNWNYLDSLKSKGIYNTKTDSKTESVTGPPSSNISIDRWVR